MDSTNQDADIKRQAREKAVKDFMAKQGKGYQDPGMALGNTMSSPQMGHGIQDYVVPNVLPTVGGMIGAAGGPLGVGVGAAAGEVGNQILGITQPSAAQILMQGSIPMAVGTLGTAARFFGGPGAEKLNAIAPEEAATVLGRLAPTVKPSVLFQQASHGGARLAMPKSMVRIDEMKAELANSSVAEKMRKPAIHALERLKNKILTNQGELSPMELQGELEGLGDMGYEATGKVKGAYDQVFKTLIEDLDEAVHGAVAGSPQAYALVKARDAFKRQSTLNEALRNVDSATKAMRGQGDAVQFNGAEVIRNLKKNRFFDSAFTEKEQKEIIGLMQKLNSIPALRPAAGQQFGAGRIASTIGVGAGLGGYAGGSEGMGIGAALGATIPPVAETLRNISIAARTEVGRSLLSELVRHGRGNLLATGASVLAAYVTASTMNPNSQMTQPVAPMPQGAGVP